MPAPHGFAHADEPPPDDAQDAEVAYSAAAALPRRSGKLFLLAQIASDLVSVFPTFPCYPSSVLHHGDASLVAGDLAAAAVVRRR